MATELKREIHFSPAWDRTNPDPKKNYGVHGVEMRWYVIGEQGVVQFVVFTNWHLPHVRRSTEASVALDPERLIFLTRPIAADVGYHSPVPHYEGQPVQQESCPVLGGRPCYYDGSGLEAERVFERLLTEGSDGVWAELELRWREEFEPDHLEQMIATAK